MLLLLACVAPSSGPGPGEAPVSRPDTGTEVVPDAPLEHLPDAPLGETVALVDVPSGLFEAPFVVTLASPVTGGEVRYTLDGTDPIAGEPYTGPLTVGTTTVLRAAVLVAGTPVETRTATYLFPAHVPDQAAPAGWPREWWTDEAGGPYAADYAMDPEVTGGATWAAAAPTLFTDLPVLSVVTDPDALFDERTGIHENFLERGDAWERAASVELLGEWAVDCGLRLHGGSGRYPANSPKKSFRLKFRSAYGDGKLDAPVFPESPATRFETLVLRAGYARSWAHSVAVSRNRADYAREAFGNAVYRRMGYAAPHVRPVHLFLDGIYWGLYLLEERPDADFLASYLGGAPEDWDALNAGVVVDGDDVAWQALLARFEGDLADPARYAAVEAALDLDAFADYYLLNVALGNIDWPDRNWFAARARVDGARWRFVTWDNEYMIVEVDDVDLAQDDPGTPGSMFQALRANEEFRVRFGDRVQRHLFGDGALTAGALAEAYAAAADAVAPGIVAESARWGDHWRDARGATDAELYTYEGHWLAEQARIARYLAGRGPYVLDALRAEGLYPTVTAPALSPAGGEVAAGEAVTVSAEGEAWYTLDGTDPREVGGEVAPGAVRVTGPVGVAASGTLSVRVRTEAGWSALVEGTYTVR
ncbi:MAG: CotH kinase family protein [Myxococcota bacterium]